MIENSDHQIIPNVIEFDVIEIVDHNHNGCDRIVSKYHDDDESVRNRVRVSIELWRSYELLC